MIVPASYTPTNTALRLKTSTFNQAYFQHCLVGTMLYWFSSTVIVYAAKYVPDFDTGKFSNILLEHTRPFFRVRFV